MSTRSGSRTPWSEWDGDLGPEGDVILIRDGPRPGELSQLAETLRADGIARSLYHAFQIAEEAIYLHTYYGYLEDDRHPVVCDEQGETSIGDHVASTPIACVFAIMEGSR